MCKRLCGVQSTCDSGAVTPGAGVRGAHVSGCGARSGREARGGLQEGGGVRRGQGRLAGRAEAPEGAVVVAGPHLALRCPPSYTIPYAALLMEQLSV